MKKADIQTRSRNLMGYGDQCPTINVKWYPYLPDMVKEFEGTGKHEYSDDELFWAWVDEQDSQNYEYPHGPFYAAEEWTRDDGWETAQNDADGVWENTRWSPKVESSGRSSGWLIVTGLPDIDEWDAIAVGRWARYVRYIGQVVSGLDYNFVWHLHWAYENSPEYNPDAGFQLTLEDA